MSFAAGDGTVTSMVESRQTEALAIIGTFAVVACVTVFLRVWSRYLGRNFCCDDYLILIAVFIFIIDTAATWQYIILSGTGYHMYDLPKKSVHEQLVALRWNFTVQMLYHPLMGIIRGSIILFLFRMKDGRRRIRFLLHTVAWLNILYSVGSTIVNLVQCTPHAYAWSRPAMDKIDANGKVIPGGKCIEARTFVLVSAGLSIFMDLIIIPIPSIMVWNLQMHRRTKVLVVAVMSLGWVATGVSVGRFIVYYYRFAPTNRDRTWDIGIVISIAEPAVHIMTACAPATKCLFRYWFPQYGTDRKTSYYHEGTVSGHRPSKLGSYGSKMMGKFNKGSPDHRDHDADVELGGAPRTLPLSPEDKNGGVFEWKAEASFQSKELTEVPPSRKSCSKTACTDSSEPVEAEPEYILGRAG